MSKYEELAQYMEEYVSNTNQAQTHFANIITKLKSDIIHIQEQAEENVGKAEERANKAEERANKAEERANKAE